MVTVAPLAPVHSHVPELPREPRWKRWTFLAIGLALAIAYFISVYIYWQPIHSGVDQNGYLVGGKQFANTLSMKQAPVMIGQPDKFDPHQFIGAMWVAATNNPQHFYPKYPLGLPLLYAISLWVGGSHGVQIAYLVSPVAMAMAVLGVFLLTRRFAGSFPAILAMLIFATSPTTSALVTNPNSHATTVCCVVWGMLFILHWWRTGGALWALAGGFLVGYAATIRYTEGALLLPLAWAALVNLRWRKLKGWLESALVLVGWLIPVAILLTYNWVEMGTLTGYDATNESTGFTWDAFYDNWETVIRNISENGLFLIFPISIAGMLGMFWWDWRKAIFLWLWIGPCLTIYTFYYWAPDGVGYLRFVLTILPPMLISAFWLLAHVRDLLPPEPERIRWKLMVPLLIIAAAAGVTLGYFGLLYDIHAKELTTYADYIQPRVKELNSAHDHDLKFSHFYTAGWNATFACSLVIIGCTAAVIASSAFLRRSIVTTLAAGVVGFLSVAVQVENSARTLERDSYSRTMQLVNLTQVQKIVPDGSVVICTDESFLHPLQFAGDYITYTGQSFDKNWVNNRPQKETDEAVLIDPIRGKQLAEALKSFDQNALNEQARRWVSEALKAKRRVFVIERVGNIPQYLKQLAEKKETPPPDFLRRFIVRPKDDTLTARRSAWWTVPASVLDESKTPSYRGRRDRRPTYAATGYQVWEIVAGAPAN
jgi:hypothetical protein